MAVVSILMLEGGHIAWAGVKGDRTGAAAGLDGEYRSAFGLSESLRQARPGYRGGVGSVSYGRTEEALGESTASWRW